MMQSQCHAQVVLKKWLVGQMDTLMYALDSMLSFYIKIYGQKRELNDPRRGNEKVLWQTLCVLHNLTHIPIVEAKNN